MQSTRPYSEADAMAQAQAALLRGQPARAADIYRMILRAKPGARAARVALAKLVPTRPAAPGGHALLSQLENGLQHGQAAQVSQTARAALQRFPAQPHLPDLLGRAYVAAGNLADAIKAFNMALHRDTAFFPAYLNLATTLRMAGQLKPAEAAMRAGLQLEPTEAQGLTTLGLILDDLGQVAEAETQFQAALASDTTLAEAHDGLCRLLEKSNRIAEMATAVEAALRACGPSDTLYLRQAQLAIHQQEFAAARDAVTSMDQHGVSPSQWRSALALLGKAEDALGNTAAAYAAFEAMNAVVVPGERRLPFDDNPFQHRIAANAAALPKLTPQTWAHPDDGHADPVFLVGFPRSGTTLLDTVLRGHPDVAVAEEQPMVQQIITKLAGQDPGHVLNTMTAEQAANLRAHWRAGFKTAIGGPIAGRLAVDKMPLSMADAALIVRLFPKARFVLALRHPCDCVLSCFMQSFVANPAMDSFTTLGQAAVTYDRVFRLWTQTADTLDLSWQTLRYEDMIDDMEGALRPLLDFLGLPFTPDMLDHQRTAKARGRINTSSYAQVTQPLYHSAAGRWTRYADHLHPHLPHLAPWIATWGYDTTAA